MYDILIKLYTKYNKQSLHYFEWVGPLKKNNYGGFGTSSFPGTGQLDPWSTRP